MYDAKFDALLAKQRPPILLIDFSVSLDRTSSFQAEKRNVELRLLSSHDVMLRYSDSMTVIKSTGQVVVSGTLSTDGTHVVLLLTLEGSKLRSEVIPRPCGHKDSHCDVLCIDTGGAGGIGGAGGEQLGLLCTGCTELKLLDLRTRKTRVAFRGDRMHEMCHGEEGRIYVRNIGTSVLGDDQTVLELDCTRVPFRQVAVYTLDTRDCKKFWYVPAPHELLIASNGVETRALACEENDTAWALYPLEYDKDGVELFEPHDAVYSRRHGVLLASTVGRERVLALDPYDASLRQVLPLPDTDTIYNLRIHGGKLLVLHVGVEPYKLSYYSIN